MSVLESRAHYGDSPPLHIHRTQDEIFHILEGELRFVIGGEELRAGAGQTLIAPKGVPHTYRVESADGARWLAVTAGEDFERFVRAFGRAAEREGLPDASGPPTPEQADALAAACRRYGIKIVGPPLSSEGTVRDVGSAVSAPLMRRCTLPDEGSISVISSRSGSAVMRPVPFRLRARMRG